MGLLIAVVAGYTGFSTGALGTAMALDRSHKFAAPALLTVSALLWYRVYKFTY